MSQTVEMRYLALLKKPSKYSHILIETQLTPKFDQFLLVYRYYSSGEIYLKIQSVVFTRSCRQTNVSLYHNLGRGNKTRENSTKLPSVDVC